MWTPTLPRSLTSSQLQSSADRSKADARTEQDARQPSIYAELFRHHRLMDRRNGDKVWINQQ